jgi:hypothetical protein
MTRDLGKNTQSTCDVFDSVLTLIQMRMASNRLLRRHGWSVDHGMGARRGVGRAVSGLAEPTRTGAEKMTPAPFIIDEANR